MLKLLLISLINIVIYANIDIVVSISPQKAFVKEIGGEKVDVTVMVKAGNSPHTYEPKPSQMRDISKADIYFSIGVEFENSWLSKFQNQNKNMKVIPLDKNIQKIDIKTYKKSNKRNLDPHIWTTPSNIKILGENIYNELIKIDSKNRVYYKTNLDTFIKKLNNTKIEILNILKNVKKNSKFIVFHPSWGYFANEFNLIQLPIEVEGKSPKPKTIAKLIKIAKSENVKAIFTAPEFSDRVAKSIAKELNIKVIKISPLSFDYLQNMIKLAKAIANKGD